MKRLSFNAQAILALLPEGFTRREMGFILDIAPSVVQYHVDRLRRLGLWKK